MTARYPLFPNLLERVDGENEKKKIDAMHPNISGHKEFSRAVLG